jgi:alkylhydroperoxidase/carboxymuconolactone decarboxylase family protein YurZ
VERVRGHETTLRRLSLRDDGYIDGLLADDRRNAEASHLDGRLHALVQVAALIAVDATPPSYMEAIAAARRWGATSDEIVGCLIAVLSVVGVARVVSAAPKVGLALGYDVESALELLGPLDDDELDD